MAMEKNYRHINKDIHYFCLMHPIDTTFACFGISFTSSSDEPLWFECYVDEERYKVEDNYKITLRALNGGAYEHYYQDDFLSLIYEGLIIPKTSEDMHTECLDWIEPIPNTLAYLHHSGQQVVGTFEPLKAGDKARIRSFSFLVDVLGVDEVHNHAKVHWMDDDGREHFETCDLNELVKHI